MPREQQPFHIAGEDRVEMLHGDRAERRVGGYTCIREHDVELALLALDLRKEPVEIGELCDVTLHAGDIFADVLQSCSQLRVAPACDVDVRAFVDEALRGGKADAAIAACDQCDLSVELAHGFLLGRESFADSFFSPVTLRASHFDSPALNLDVL